MKQHGTRRGLGKAIRREHRAVAAQRVLRTLTLTAISLRYQ